MLNVTSVISPKMLRVKKNVLLQQQKRLSESVKPSHKILLKQAYDANQEATGNILEIGNFFFFSQKTGQAQKTEKEELNRFPLSVSRNLTFFCFLVKTTTSYL